jgi:hypothetical protein
MKTAYELAMERLGKSTPTTKLTAQQKNKLAELDAKYTAKIAAREIALQAEIASASAAGDFENAEKLRQQLVNERQALQAELDSRKEAVRQGA